MILPVRVLDWSAVESSHKLNAGNGAFPGTWPTQLLCKYRVVEDTKVAQRTELVQGVETFPIVNQVVLHRDHVKVSEARLVVHVANAIFVQCQSLQIFQDAEFDHLVPRLNAVAFQVDEFEQAEVALRHLIQAANPAAVVPHEVQLLDVEHDGGQGHDLLPVEPHFDEDDLAEARMSHPCQIFSLQVV